MAATTREWFEGSPDDIAESFSRVISNPAFLGKDVPKNLQEKQASILKRTEFWRELVGLQSNLAFQKSKILKGFRKLVHMKKWEMTDEEIEDFIGKATTRTIADASILKNAYQKNRHTLWIQPIFGKGDTGGRTKDDGAGVGLLAEFDAAAEEKDETEDEDDIDGEEVVSNDEEEEQAEQEGEAAEPLRRLGALAVTPKTLEKEDSDKEPLVRKSHSEVFRGNVRRICPPGYFVRSEKARPLLSKR